MNQFRESCLTKIKSFLEFSTFSNHDQSIHVETQIQDIINNIQRGEILVKTNLGKTLMPRSINAIVI